MKNVLNQEYYPIHRFINLSLLLVLAFMLVSSIFYSVLPIYASPQGSTTAVYVKSGEEINSSGPNTLAVENGQVSIILADGSKMVIIPQDRE